MLCFPGMIESQPVSQFDLIKGLMEQTLFCSVRPRSRQLMLIKKAEFHGRFSLQSPVTDGRVTLAIRKPILTAKDLFEQLLSWDFNDNRSNLSDFEK